MNPHSLRTLFAAILSMAAVLFPAVALSEIASFTGSDGRTLMYRYELKAGWNANVPRGLLVYFHMGSDGTQEDMLYRFMPNQALAHRHNLVPVVIASPEATPANKPNWHAFTDQRYSGIGVRAWRMGDEELVHELLQSQFDRRFRVDFGRIVFAGELTGACLLDRFVARYGKFYGGGVLLDCGCFRGLSQPRALWNPPMDFRQNFRVYVRSTKDDYSYAQSRRAYGYYRYAIGLDTHGDLEGAAGLCTTGNVTDEKAVEWLLDGTGLPTAPVEPHFKRVSPMDGLVGITVDGQGALWVVRQDEFDSHAVLWRSVDRGENLEAAARVELDIHDIDAAGGALVVTAAEGAIQSLHRSTNKGMDFRRLRLDGGALSNTVSDTHDNLYAIAPNASGYGQDAYLSEDYGGSWTPMGAPDEPLVFRNPDSIYTTGPSAFLMLGRGPIRWLGTTEGNDWNRVGSFREEPFGHLYSLAWDGSAFWALPASSAETSGDPTAFISMDRGLTWEEERLPAEARVSSRSRFSAVGNGELLLVAGTGNRDSDGYLRDANGAWQHISGGATIGSYPGATIGDFQDWRRYNSAKYRVAVDRTRGDVYLTDGPGLFRLDGQFRSAQAVGRVPDADSDGIPDALDAFPADGSEYLDSDADGLGNGVDDDDDGDGLRDQADGMPLDRFETTDSDGDGVGNSTDRDDDGDGVPDVLDAFPLNERTHSDTDGDGIADSIDDDDDGDGAKDFQDAFPKYPHEWRDTDNDGIGDNIDVDDDNDGLRDAFDPRPRSGRAKPHLVPLKRLPFRQCDIDSQSPEWFPAWRLKQAQMHAERPSSHVYPQGKGKSQEYGQLSLGNGPSPDLQFMIDHLDGVTLMYFDRNDNGDLSDDGPPVRKSVLWTCGADELVWLEVTYSSGITVPYTISYSPLPTVRQGGGWIGEVELQNGSTVLVLTIDRDIDGLFTGSEDYVCVDVDGDGRLECDEYDSPERLAHGDVTTLAGKRLRVLVAESGHRVELKSFGAAHHVSPFPAASNPARQGFVRVINRSPYSGTVEIDAFEESGTAYGPVSLAIEGGAAIHFNSRDLELGNSDKGLLSGVGSGSGGWRLELRSELDIEVLAYIRTVDGFVTSMHDRVPGEYEYYEVPIFNPASNTRQVSKLRLINPGRRDTAVLIDGTDDRGRPSETARVTVPAGGSRELSSQQLETGNAHGLSGALGDGHGKWRLGVESRGAIHVMNLLESPTGHLANLSTWPSATGDQVRRVPFFPAASHPSQQGFVRVINRRSRSGTVEITAIDESGAAHGPVSLAIDGRATVHFNSEDLEVGNAGKGLSSGVGLGRGAWHLELRTDLTLDVLGYIRSGDGFVTSMHDRVPVRDGYHYVPIFNPGSNTRQVSKLRLVNVGQDDAAVAIEGTDDRGRGSRSVRVTIPAGASREFSARQLETGNAEGLSGFLGDGHGKWRLRIGSDHPIHVMSLLQSPTGHLTNLSTTPDSPGGT